MKKAMERRNQSLSFKARIQLLHYMLKHRGNHRLKPSINNIRSNHKKMTGYNQEIQRNQALIYEQKFQGERYEGSTIFLNSDNNMGYPLTENDEIKHMIGMIMAQQYSLKPGLRHFVKRGNMWCHHS